jgi:hypothetical protein
MCNPLRQGEGGEVALVGWAVSTFAREAYVRLLVVRLSTTREMVAPLGA